MFEQYTPDFKFRTTIENNLQKLNNSVVFYSYTCDNCEQYFRNKTTKEKILKTSYRYTKTIGGWGPIQNRYYKINKDKSLTLLKRQDVKNIVFQDKKSYKKAYRLIDVTKGLGPIDRDSETECGIVTKKRIAENWIAEKPECGFQRRYYKIIELDKING